MLTGTSGADVICGLAGNDTISGLAGNDTLLGGGGNDTLTGGAGNDTINGEAGSDTAGFAAAPAAVSVNLAAGTATGNGTDTLSAMENVLGSAFADTLAGTTGGNRFTAGAGADTVNAGAGRDTLNGQGGNDVLNGQGGNDTLDGGAGTDTLAGRCARECRIRGGSAEDDGIALVAATKRSGRDVEFKWFPDSDIATGGPGEGAARSFLRKAGSFAPSTHAPAEASCRSLPLPTQNARKTCNAVRRSPVHGGPGCLHSRSQHVWSHADPR